MTCNIDIPRSLKFCDSLLRRKFKNRKSTISFELHARLADEIDLENVQFFGTSKAQWLWPWPWIGSKSYWYAHIRSRSTHIPN